MSVRGLARDVTPDGGAARLGAVLYVAVVAVLAASAWGGGPVLTEVFAFLLCLPAVIVTLPVIYLVGAAAWTTADDTGQATWQVTTTFTALFAVSALINVALIVWIWRHRDRSTSPRRDDTFVSH